MRILRFSQYITNSNIPEFDRNKSGYGRSVWDISRYSSKLGNEEFLYTYANRQERKLEDVTIIEGKFEKVYKHFDLKSFLLVFKMVLLSFLLKGFNLRARIACVVYSSKYGYISQVIKEVNPNIIHIHGLTYWTLPFILAAKKSGIPYVVTLHGLNMNVIENKISRSFEKKQIERLNSEGVILTLIGSGMLDTIIENCEVENEDGLVVINHGMDGSTFTFDNDTQNIKKELGIIKKKVILSVGSLSERRNQITLVRAVSKMPKDVIDSIVVFIVGNGPMRTALESEINKFGLENTIKLLGEKNHSELSSLYAISDVTAVLSKVEGFGRPILESFLFGVPVVAFSDLDAVQDLYKDGCMYLVNDRDDECVSNKIVEVLNRKKDSKMIKEFASTKTWAAASCKYQEIYSRVANEYKNIKHLSEENSKHE